MCVLKIKERRVGWRKVHNEESIICTPHQILLENDEVRGSSRDEESWERWEIQIFYSESLRKEWSRETA